MKTVLAILLLPIFCYAQKGKHCKLDVDAVDKFSKKYKIEKEVKVNGAGFDGDSYLTMRFCKYDSTRFFRITWIRRKSMVVGTSDRLTFLFDDQQTVSAFPVDIYSSNSRGEQEVLSATYVFEDKIVAIEKLTKNVLASIRIVFNDVHKDIDVKEKFKANIMDAASCVYN